MQSRNHGGANFSVTSQKLNGYHVLRVVDRSDDGDGGLTVTNDAENVLVKLKRQYGAELTPKTIILYRDSERRWDELVHNGEKFEGFRVHGSRTFNDAVMSAIQVRKMGNG